MIYFFTDIISFTEFRSGADFLFIDIIQFENNLSRTTDKYLLTLYEKTLQNRMYIIL